METSVEQEQNAGPVDKFQLFQNYPNPFNPTTVIEYHLNRSASVVIAIYNGLGEKVTTLVDKRQSRGLKRIIWNGTDDHGATVASGLYLCALKVGGITQTKKLTLIR
jgi:flagellar hook assembly protein FlgD